MPSVAVAAVHYQKTSLESLFLLEAGRGRSHLYAFTISCLGLANLRYLASFNKSGDCFDFLFLQIGMQRQARWVQTASDQ